MVGGPLFGYVIQKFGIRYALHLCYLSTMLSGLALFFFVCKFFISRKKIPVSFNLLGCPERLLLPPSLPYPSSLHAWPASPSNSPISFNSTRKTKNKCIWKNGSHIWNRVHFCTHFLNRCHENRRRFGPPLLHDISVDESNGPAPQINITNVVRILQKPGVLNVMAKKNGGVIPFLMIIAILNLYIIEKFNATNTENQIMQMMMGVFIMFSNGFGVIWLRKKFDEQTLLIIGSLSFVVGYTLFTLVFFNFWMLLVIMPFVSLGMSVVATCSDSLLTALVEESEQGIVLGTATSFNSLVRTFSPLFAGSLLQNYGFQSLTLLGVFGSLLAIGLMIVSPVDENLIKKHKTE
ncbi:hypothetical protein CAEBREN_32723 [Caenorhabditis brenneri]|uniref:Major facilitator superfamily (MFS) profile domain-containing protein n=1 Tax=Caenorhabditis brenneri TaxID=135651 RepID=G0P6A0_CAEBE|nr:hypothetical protein CAEBREN_32723 [Caenorhabditis brenneri]